MVTGSSGDYTAKEHVSKSYSIYSQVTHKEVDDAARGRDQAKDR